MQIDIKLMVARVSDAKEIGGWVCGTLAPTSASPDSVLIAAQATRPWITQVAVINEEDALVEFVNLNLQDTHQITGFIRQYGLFSFGDEVGMAGHPENVKAYWKKAKQLGLTPFATNLASFRDSRERVATMLKLARSRRGRERDAAFQEFLKINRGLGELMRRTHPKDFDKQLLSYYISQGLASVAIGVATHRSKMVAVALAPDVRSALYVALLSSIVRGTKLKTCARIGCINLFVITRPKDYCSVHCQNLAKVKRYRKRQRRKRAKGAI
jgi:predicted RNA-binding Zn ribbon-like protein